MLIPATYTGHVLKSEYASHLYFKMVQKLQNDIVVKHFQIIYASDVSFEKKRTNNLATSTQSHPNCHLLTAAIHIIVEFWRLTYWSIFSDILSIDCTIHTECSFITNDKISQEIFVSVASFGQTPCKVQPSLKIAW